MDLYSLIEAGGNVRLEVSAESLCQFADRLIEKAQEARQQELQRQQRQCEQEKWLTTEEACKLCGVCKTTLWQWDRAGYLKPAKVGQRKRYALSDIKAILAGHGTLPELKRGAWKADDKGGE